MIGPVEMGALLKKIRLSKNLTLKELASDYLSVSFLSKFEQRPIITINDNGKKRKEKRRRESERGTE